MATVTFTPNSTVTSYDMAQARLDFPTLLNGYGQATLAPSEISLRDDASNRTVIYGNNLTYTTVNGKLVITGGTITSIDIWIGGSTPVIQIDGLNLSAAEFGALLTNGSANLYNLIFEGNDTINGGANSDKLKGFDGNDRLNGLGGNDTLWGDVGDDQVYGGTGNDTAYGSVGNDSLYGEDGNDNLQGGDGNDLIYGGNHNDLLYGQNNNDQLYGQNGNDSLYGQNGNDTLSGEAGNDVIYGGANNDTAYGSTGNDILYGEDGNDNLQGGDNNDTLYGGNNDDKLYGQNHNDRLFGQNGNDSLSGGNGNDTLNGGAGIDTLVGDGGNDVFVFDAPLITANVDVVTDFNVAADTIHLENAVFIGLANGVLAANRFASNTTGNAQDSADRIIYEKDTGKLFFDRDGSGGTYQKVHFATIDDGLNLTNADFFVI